MANSCERGNRAIETAKLIGESRAFLIQLCEDCSEIWHGWAFYITGEQGWMSTDDVSDVSS